VPCSLHLAAVQTGQQRGDQRRQPLQVGQASHRRGLGRPGGRFEIGPLRGDQRLAAIGQHDKQLKAAMTAHLAQSLQPLTFERMPGTGDHHRTHRPTR